MVIQKNPDENVNHLPSAAVCEVDGISNVNDQSCVNKRYPVFALVAFVCLGVVTICFNQIMFVFKCYFYQCAQYIYTSRIFIRTLMTVSWFW